LFLEEHLFNPFFNNSKKLVTTIVVRFLSDEVSIYLRRLNGLAASASARFSCALAAWVRAFELAACGGKG
jgi:hypothetical protein